MNVQHTRVPLKETVLRILSDDTLPSVVCDSWRITYLTKAVSAFLEREVSPGAVTACVARLWGNDELPEGWVWDTTSTPSLVRKANNTEKQILRELTTEAMNPPIKALIDMHSGLILSIDPPSIIAFECMSEERKQELFDGQARVILVRRVPGTNKFEVV